MPMFRAFFRTGACVAQGRAFPAADNKVIAENPVFDLSDEAIWNRFPAPMPPRLLQKASLPPHLARNILPPNS
jgi:hypothetical protein